MSLNISELKKLCDFDGEKYVSKSGNEYIKALGEIYKLDNKNDRPFTIEDIVKQPTMNEFKFSGLKDFEFICKLKANPLIISKDGKRKNEKIIAYNFANTFKEKVFTNSLGVSYIITCQIDNKEHIIKIGSSRTSFAKRLASYNCGVVNNWRTASTTNIKILQSMVATRREFNLYIYDCSEDLYTIDWHGIHSVKFASPKALAVEDIMVKQFINQFKIKPLANVQTNATEINN